MEVEELLALALGEVGRDPVPVAEAGQDGIDLKIVVIETNPPIDTPLRDIATALLAEDFPTAEERLGPLADNYPYSAIVPFLQAEVCSALVFCFLPLQF